MASRVERTDVVSGASGVVQADTPTAPAASSAAGIVVLPPAQLITQAQENLGIDLPSPARRAKRAGGMGGHAEVQGVLRDLVGVPLVSVRPSSGAGATADTVRRYFFERRDPVAQSFMRDYGFSPAQAEAAADQWVGRNVARWEYQQREHHGDSLRALTVAGMLVAIASAGGDVDPTLLAAARATQAQFRERLIAASMTSGTDRDQVAAQVDAYLGNLGSRVNASTSGWDAQVRALRDADYYTPFNPQTAAQQNDVIPFAPPHYATPQHAQTAPVTEQAHAEAMRRAERAASADHAIRVEQRRRDDLKAHLANLEAQGRPVGGPTYG